MIPMPDWAMWLGWLVRLALGATVIVAVTGLLARFCTSGVRQRTVWRAGIVALTLFIVCEFAGIGGLLAWTGERQAEAGIEPAANVGFGAQPQDQLAGIGGVAFGFGARPTPASVWWPGIVWLGGAALWMGRSAFLGALLLLWRRRHCTFLSNELLAERVRALAVKLGLRRVPKIMESAAVVTPAVAGLWRPRLILPARFAEDFEPAKQEVMLAHELAHVAGHDPSWQVIADGIVAVLWWQPLVWWMRSRHRSANETAADEASGIVADGPALLAACLVEMGGKLTRTPRTGWIGMAGGGFRSSLGRRVERLLALKPSTSQPRRLRSLVFLTLLPVLLTAGAVFSIAWAQPLQGDSTMFTKASWKRSLAGIVLCATFGVGAETHAQQPPAGQPADPFIADQGPGAAGFGEGGEAGDLVLKVFKLKHRDPEDVIKVANQLVSAGARGMFGVASPGGFGAAPGLPGTGAPGPGIGLPGGEGGGLPAAQFPRLAADKRTRTLIARGRTDDLSIITDLIAIIDVQDGQPAPKAKNLRVFRLKHVDSKNILGVLAGLEIASISGPCLAAELDRHNLIVMGDPAGMRQIEQVIQALDVDNDPKTTK